MSRKKKIACIVSAGVLNIPKKDDWMPKDFKGCVDYRSQFLEREVDLLNCELTILRQLIDEVNSFVKKSNEAVNSNLAKKEEQYRSDPSDRMNDLQDRLDRLEEIIDLTFSDEQIDSIDEFSANIKIIAGVLFDTGTI